MRNNLIALISVFFAFFAVFSFAINAEQSCNVDVYGLHVSDDSVSAYIKNYDDSDKTVGYTFYVDDDEINSGVIDIEAGEKELVSHIYSFGVGRFEVRIEIESSCGSLDDEEMVYTKFDNYDCDEPVYCIEGALRCDCDDKKVYECINDDWVLLAQGENAYCEICGDEDCCGLPEPCWDCELCGCDDCSCDHDHHDCDECDHDCGDCGSDHDCDYWDCDHDNDDCDHDSDYCDYWDCDHDKPDERDCGVYIEEFNYIDNIEEDGKSEVEIRVKNTGEKREIITVRFFADGIMKDTNSVSVGSDRSFVRTFSFYPTIGTHEFKVSAKANCGSTDWMSKIIKVVDLGDHVEPPEEPGSEPEPTIIEISPMNLDIPRYDARTVVINIQSETPQYYRIDIRDYNFDSNWIEFDREFYVENDKSAYIYVSPDEYGEYEMDVYVTARGEWKTVKEHITFFVASPDEDIEEEADWFGGVVYFFTHPATIIIAIIISLAIVVYMGTRLLIPEPEAWEV